jgi:hypothetical protein
MIRMLQSQVEWWESPRGEGGAGRVAFAALIAFTFVLLLAPQSTYPTLASLHLAAVAAGLAIAAHLCGRLAGESAVTAPRGTGLALCLGAWAIATAPFSYWPGGSVSMFIDLFVKSLAIFWLISQVVDSTARLRRLVSWLVLLAIPLAVVAVRNFLSGSFLAGSSPDAQRIAGYDAPLTGNPNDLALMLNLLVPLTYALRGVSRRPLVRLALAGLLFLEVVGVLLTYSRAGFLTLALVWIVHALRTLRGIKRIALAAAVAGALVVVAMFPSSYVSHLGTAVDMDADASGSAQERWRGAVAAVGLVADHPLLGVGLGMNVLAITHETGGWRSVHNVYLQYAADLGLPGLFLFLALGVRCLRDAAAVRRSRPPDAEGRDLAKLALGIELALWAFAVAGMFHPAGYHFYFYYLGGMALAARAIHLRRTKS